MTQREGDVRGWIRERLGRLRPAPVAPGGTTAPAAPVVRIAVVTDSAAALPPEWVDDVLPAGVLTVVPMPVQIGPDIYSEGDDDLEAALMLALAAGTAVKTSRPSPGQFERAYQNAAAAGFDAVVSLHISAQLSGTVEAARLAAGKSSIPVHVVDTQTVGMVQGYAVQDAVAAAAAGGELDGVSDAAEAALEHARILFYVPSLDQLRRGGRIGAAASWLGTVFAIKPILAVRDGVVVPLEKVRTAAKAIARLEELVLAEVGSAAGARVRVCIHHFGNEAQARELAARLQDASAAVSSIMLSRLPAVLAAHAGLGVLGVVITATTLDSGADPAQVPAR
ncbi:DegV family protein [Arthrobacter sp. 35W]|uniref:DegV family protein n=1 Tax=Arthrobacter sp. 35W TaxID=1132441 RepID=UPI00040175EA|nr:DegV family protein [Arthrobacter sp. 35W]